MMRYLSSALRGPSFYSSNELPYMKETLDSEVSIDTRVIYHFLAPVLPVGDPLKISPTQFGCIFYYYFYLLLSLLLLLLFSF